MKENSEVIKISDNMISISLSEEDLMPTFEEKRGQEYTSFGKNNDWPQMIMDLYKRCVNHGSIVRGKSRYIYGKGLKIKSGKTPLFEKANRREKLNKVFKKVVKDWEIYRGFYLKVKFNALGQVVRVYHVPFLDVRTNESRSWFWISKDWANKRVSKKKIDEFQGMDGQIDKTKDAIFYYFDEDEEGGIYPMPNYLPGLKMLKTGLAVEDFHYNNAHSGFTAGTLVTVKAGTVDGPEKRKVKELFDSKTTSSKNAGRVIMYFAKRDEDAPSIQSLLGDRLDEKYTSLDEKIEKQTFTSHQVTSPMLFGIKTEGQLGGRTELLEAWELFSNNYVEPEQENLIEGMETFLQICGYTVELEIDGVSPIGMDYIELFDKDLISREYVQEKLNLPRFEGSANGKEDEISQGLKEFEKNGRLATDFEKVEEFNVEFRESPSTIESKVLQAIKERPKYSIKDYALGLKTDEDVIIETIEKLIQKGLVKQSSGGGMSVTPSGDLFIEGSKGNVLIETLYKYDGPKDSRNRDFCAKLMELNRLYSREEIDKISAELGYDVWKYRGGWYKREDGVNIPHCRHDWKQVIVRRKK